MKQYASRVFVRKVLLSLGFSTVSGAEQHRDLHFRVAPLVGGRMRLD